MAKPKTIYSCTECGGQSPKWQGQCPHCNAWNTLVESVAETASNNRFATLAGVNAERGQVLQLSKVKTQDIPRQPTGIGEFDRVLGGGLVSGGVV
ncbi:MAG: DNA repair protein RadA, partial [Rhodocyclaceae bacterium]|nr:DNA repair protein RadA [Rhodocyclaceae bacterium]